MKTKTFTERTLILLTPEQKEALNKRAREANMYIGDYIRNALFPTVEKRMVEDRLADLERKVQTLENAVQTLKTPL